MHKFSERNVFKVNLFLVRSCKILAKIAFFARNTTLAKFLQEMSNCCKIAAKILQDLLSNSPILQDMYFYKNFAKVVLIARFLQKLLFL